MSRSTSGEGGKQRLQEKEGRPGSAQEKGQLLRRIENPDQSNTSHEAVEGLRQWLRHYQRARDLKLTTPDPSVMLRGLDALVKKPVQEAPEVAFRMNLLRYHLKVDFNPSEESVLAVHRALLAEFEQMGFRKKARTPQDSSAQGPQVRAVEAGSAPMSRSTRGEGGNIYRYARIVVYKLNQGRRRRMSRSTGGGGGGKHMAAGEGRMSRSTAWGRGKHVSLCIYNCIYTGS